MGLCVQMRKKICKDCRHGQAGKRGFPQNMKIIIRKIYDQEYATKHDVASDLGPEPQKCYKDMKVI
jgi:hypothetical protein